MHVLGGVGMQLDEGRTASAGVHEGIAATFSDWVDAHRAFGGDFNESAFRAGLQATLTAYRGGLSLSQAFELGRQAYYLSLR